MEERKTFLLHAAQLRRMYVWVGERQFGASSSSFSPICGRCYTARNDDRPRGKREGERILGLMMDQKLSSSFLRGCVRKWMMAEEEGGGGERKSTKVTFSKETG